MKKTVIVFLLLTMAGTAWAQMAQKNSQSNTSIEAFWEKFRTAVSKGDRVTVASLSQFPIGMPYGVSAVRNSSQLAKRYREVFNGEANAVTCFRKSQPQINPENPKEFTVGCKNGAGDEVVIYSFTRTRNGWKFNGLDNINE